MRRSTFWLVSVLALAVGCRDATGLLVPLDPPPEVGTYDFTTELATFRFETDGSQCPPYQGQAYCFFSTPANGATLSGTLTIGPNYTDTIPTYGRMFTDVKASLSGMFCSSWSPKAGCVGLMAVTAELDHGRLVTQYYGEGPQLTVWGPQGIGELLIGPFVLEGDSVSAGLYWTLSVPGRSPPAHTGHVILRKRH